MGEGNAISESQPATGNLDLQAKKLGVLVRVNNELLRFASPSAEGLIRYDMARSAALKADQAMLEGTGGTQIKGLMTYAGITSHAASTIGANGNFLEPQDVALMEGKLPDAVGMPTAWLMRKNMFAALMNRRADAVAANDAKGQFMFHPMRGAADAPPSEIYGTRVVRSSQISAGRTKGSASNLTYVILGYFPDWVVRAPPEIPLNVKIMAFSAVHGFAREHVFALFPPHSVHDSVHEKHVHSATRHMVCHDYAFANR